MDICDSFRLTGRVYDGMPTATANKIKNNPTIVSKITFDYGIANISSESFFVIDGDFLTPDKPSFAGYIFMGWYADSAYQTPFDFTTPITDDITIYAKFADYTGDISGINDQINTLAQNLNSAKAELQAKIDTKADAAAVNAAIAKLQNAIAALEKAKDNYIAADTALKAELEAAIAKAKQEAIDAAKGYIPHIGENGNWWIGSSDTGVGAVGTPGAPGTPGKDGVTPQLRINGENIWEVSYDGGKTWASMGISAVGASGANGQNGAPGQNGIDGVGIATIEKTGSNGNVDTYTITLTNGKTFPFTVTNGVDGKDGLDGKDGQDAQSPSVAVPTVIGSAALVSNIGTLVWILTKKKVHV